MPSSLSLKFSIFYIHNGGIKTKMWSVEKQKYGTFTFSFTWQCLQLPVLKCAWGEWFWEIGFKNSWCNMAVSKLQNFPRKFPCSSISFLYLSAWCSLHPYVSLLGYSKDSKVSQVPQNFSLDWNPSLSSPHCRCCHNQYIKRSFHDSNTIEHCLPSSQEIISRKPWCSIV